MLTSAIGPQMTWAQPTSTAADAEAASDSEREEQEGDSGRTFLFRELVLSGFYSSKGVQGLPPGDGSRDHVELSPRPPGNYLGLDLVRTFTTSSRINEKVFPRWLPLTAMTLHPRLVLDRTEAGDTLDQLAFAPQDFWVRFNPGGVDRLMLRVGQFVLPYGVNPVLAPRQRFRLPLESTDLGLKWDWGLGLKGPIGRYDWEVALTLGSGEAIHSTHLFSGSEKKSFLFTGRIGAPTYWDFQYGLSFLYGDLPPLQGAQKFREDAISRWRVGLDAFYRKGTYLSFGGQVAFGQDGFSGDADLVRITDGETANVLGLLGWADWVIPKNNDLQLAIQLESVTRDRGTSESDDTALILEVGYSFSTSVTVRLDYRNEYNRSMGEENDAIYLTFVYYDGS